MISVAWLQCFQRFVGRMSADRGAEWVEEGESEKETVGTATHGTSGPPLGPRQQRRFLLGETCSCTQCQKAIAYVLNASFQLYTKPIIYHGFTPLNLGNKRTCKPVWQQLFGDIKLGSLVPTIHLRRRTDLGLNSSGQHWEKSKLHDDKFAIWSDKSQ